MPVTPNARGAQFLEHRGCKLAWSVEGDGPPLLFIQGTAIHGDGWLPQIAELAADHRCLWFDNRGMCASQPVGNCAITIAQLAEDARVLLDAQGWSAAHVVGHSLGGVVALDLALTWPERVLSLSLLCTAARGANLVSINASMLLRGLRMELGTKRSRRNAFLEIVLPPAQLATCDKDRAAAELEPLFGHDIAVRPPIAWKQITAMKAWDATARLGELARIPTLVVGAKHDLIARREGVRDLARGIPGARLVEIEDAAHGVTITHRERVNALLREHVARATRG
jgi:pimeloyl-ACP methyl ester carboxylesterase